jgi:hypothetical protein
MKDTITLVVKPGGNIETIYQDGIEEFAKEMGATVSSICRLSNVEWEKVEKPLNARFPATEGWSVRSAKNPNLALRHESSLNAGIGERYIDSVVCSDNLHLAIILFSNRKDALELEEKFYQQLMQQKGFSNASEASK